MRRLYFLVPSTAIAHKVVDGFKKAGVEERQIHVVAAPNTKLDHLPKAALAEKSYLVSALKKVPSTAGVWVYFSGLRRSICPSRLSPAELCRQWG